MRHLTSILILLPALLMSQPSSQESSRFPIHRRAVGYFSPRHITFIHRDELRKAMADSALAPVMDFMMKAMAPVCITENTRFTMARPGLPDSLKVLKPKVWYRMYAPEREIEVTKRGHTLETFSVFMSWGQVFNMDRFYEGQLGDRVVHITVKRAHGKTRFKVSSVETTGGD